MQVVFFAQQRLPYSSLKTSIYGLKDLPTRPFMDFNCYFSDTPTFLYVLFSDTPMFVYIGFRDTPTFSSMAEGFFHFQCGASDTPSVVCNLKVGSKVIGAGGSAAEGYDAIHW